MSVWLLVVALAVPDHTLTPGAVRPLSRTTVCTIKWGRDRRHVTTKMRQAVFRAYGIDWTLRASYEVDHLIPRDLGGADVVANLWPQPLAEAKRVKDPQEVALHRAVCAGTITLAAARATMQRWPDP